MIEFSMLSYMQVYLIPPYQVTRAVVNYLQTCMFHATLCMFISIKPTSLNYIMMDTSDSSVADLGNLVHFRNVNTQYPLMGRNIVRVNQNYHLISIMYKLSYFVHCQIGKVTGMVTRYLRVVGKLQLSSDKQPCWYLVQGQ